MEGQLFPDTYFFYSSATEDDVIRVMKNNFQNKMAKLRELDDYKKINLTDNENYINLVIMTNFNNIQIFIIIAILYDL